ncbi:hypothetical protein GCM10023094_26410 [Rhodococcus olei]|uniref:Uncharacterized protein n=1 Tax=Rhodococcus olei TaxID=2161675 RepID=A0ABP8P556_9NOCA
MTGDHADLIAELRSLAVTVLDRVEPLLERAAEAAAAAPAEGAEAAAGASGCSWCPVCALVALIRGEQHELVAMIASQIAALLALVRALLDEHAGHRGPPAGGPGDSTSAPRRGFVPIQVRIEDNPAT